MGIPEHCPGCEKLRGDMRYLARKLRTTRNVDVAIKWLERRTAEPPPTRGAVDPDLERLRDAIRLLLWYADNGWNMRAGHGEALAEARFLVPRALDEERQDG